MDSAEIHLTTLLHQTPRGGNNTSFSVPQPDTTPVGWGLLLAVYEKKFSFLGRFFVILFELLEIYTTFALGK